MNRLVTERHITNVREENSTVVDKQEQKQYKLVISFIYLVWFSVVCLKKRVFPLL